MPATIHEPHLTTYSGTTLPDFAHASRTETVEEGETNVAQDDVLVEPTPENLDRFIEKGLRHVAALQQAVTCAMAMRRAVR